MSKWYEIKFLAICVVAVEVEDDQSEEEAQRIASEDISTGDFDVVESELETGPITDGFQLETIKRHANKVLDI